MGIIILPGYSEHNRKWAEDASKFLDGSEVVYWPHWRGGKFTVDGEVSKIVDRLVKEDEVYILAKSIGTLVAVKAADDLKGMVKKMVLCGLPLNDLDEGRGDMDVYRSALPKFTKSELILIQNDEDHHGSWDAVKKFVEGINPDLVVEKKPRDDHEYPYYQEFVEFLA